MTPTASRRLRSGRATPVRSRCVSTVPAVAQALEGRLLMAADFRISEFMASNVSTLADEDGQFNDWIEIRNTGDAAGNLAGYKLTDSPALSPSWTFPSVTLPAGGHLVVFAS